jgi:hypothetical protein
MRRCGTKRKSFQGQISHEVFIPSDYVTRIYPSVGVKKKISPEKINFAKIEEN